MSGLLFHADGNPVPKGCKCLECRPPDVDREIAFDARKIQRDNVRRARGNRPTRPWEHPRKHPLPEYLIHPKPISSRLARVLREKGERCYYCVQRATTIDHKLPVSRGGKNNLENLVPACKRCNEDKGNMTAEEYIATGQPWLLPIKDHERESA